MGTVCYEEPETCLHPQLQLQMGRLLIRMVRQGITVVATTHSDIILQHVNNIPGIDEYLGPDYRDSRLPGMMEKL